MNSQVLNILQIILAILLILLILLQSKGAGIGATFGGDFSFYGTKRGAERVLFISTIIIATLFLVLSLTGVIRF